MLLLFFASFIKAANKKITKGYINQTNKTADSSDQNSIQVCNNRKRKLKDSDFTDQSKISESKRIRCKKETNKSGLKNKKNASEQHQFNNIPLFVHEYTLEDSDEEYRPISSQQIHNKEELEVESQPRKYNTNNSANTNISLATKEKNEFSFNSKNSDIDLELLIQSVISKPNKESLHFDSSSSQLECKNKESFILDKEETLLMNEKQEPLFLDTGLPLINTADLENVLNSNYQMTNDTQINALSFAGTSNIQPEQNLRHMERKTFSMNKDPSTSNFKLQNSSETNKKCFNTSNSHSFQPDEVDLKIHMPINSQFNEDNARHSKSLGINEHKTDLENPNNADPQYINSFQECYNYYTKVESYDPQEFERNDNKYMDLDTLKIVSALGYPKSDGIKECSQRTDGIILIKQFDLEESSNLTPIATEQTHRKDCFESENIKSSALVGTITNEEKSKTNTILETSIDYGINGHHNTKRLNNNIVPKITNNKTKRCRIIKRFKSKNVDLINTRDTSALNEKLLDIFKSMSGKDSCRCISTDSIPAGIYITDLYKDVEISKIVKDIESMYIIRFNNVIFNFYNFSHVLRIFEHYDDKKRPEIKKNINLFLKNFIRDNILDREFWLEIEKANDSLATYTSDSFVELNTVLCIDDFREYMLKFCKKYEKIMGNFTEKLSILRHRRHEDHTFSSVAKVFLFEFEQFFKNERFSIIFVLFPEINYLLDYLNNDKFYFYGLKQAVATISFVIFKFLFLKENFFIDLKHHQAIYNGDYLKSNLFLKFLLNTKALLYATYCKITLMKVDSDLKKKMIFHIYLHFLRLKNSRVFTLLKFDEHVYLENSEKVVNYDWIILSSESIFVDSDRLEIFLIDDFAINSVRNFADNANSVLYKTLAIHEEYNDICHGENEDINLIEQKYKESKKKFYVKLLESLSH